MITTCKFRAVISVSEFDHNNLPETFTIKGKVFDKAEDAQKCVEEFINEMYADLISGKIFHKGYDPSGYNIGRLNEYALFIHHNNIIMDDHLRCCAKSFMYDTEVRPFTCYFTNHLNKITYRTMDLIQFDGKWYIHSALNGSIIGIIDNNESLNEILTQADKIYDELDPDYQIPVPKLKNN